jgi:hypothetical protein
MSDPRLTAEIIGEFQDALAGVIETDKGWSSTLADVVSTHQRITTRLERELAEARAEIARLENVCDAMAGNVETVAEKAKAEGIEIGRAQEHWNVKSMLEGMPLLPNWTPGQTMRFVLEQIAALPAPPAETKEPR